MVEYRIISIDGTTSQIIFSGERDELLEQIEIIHDLVEDYRVEQFDANKGWINVTAQFKPASKHELLPEIKLDNLENG